MKAKNIFKTLAFAMLMPAILLATACSDIYDNEDTDQKVYTLPVTVNVTRQGDEATTKATYNETDKRLEFSTGDQLFIEGHDRDRAGQFVGTLTWVSGGKFSGIITTQNEYSGTAESLFLNANDAHATLLPAGYKDYGYIIIDGPDSEDLIEIHGDKAFASTKKKAVEQFSHEYANTYYDLDGFVLEPQNAILNFTIGGLTANATNVYISLETDASHDIIGEANADKEGVATFAMGITEGSYNDLTLTVGGNKITFPSNTKLNKGHIYNITRSVGPSLADAFVDGNTTVIKFGNILTLSATYNSGLFGTVDISGNFSFTYTGASMAKDGDNLVIHVVNSTQGGAGNMTINTVNYTYKWDNQTLGNSITLTAITIGGHSIKPLPTKK